MEACSSCYFALLCSECCKNQHNKEYNCKIQMSQDRIIKIQNELNNSKIDKNSNLSSTLRISTSKSRTNSIIKPLLFIYMNKYYVFYGFIGEQLEIREYISSSLVSSKCSKTLTLTTHSRSSVFSKILDYSSSPTYLRN